jgi:transcriptional regulatory protein GAL4
MADTDAQERQSGTSQATELQFSEQLTTSAIIDRLVDTYFQLYHSSYPILHESTFREKCRNRSSGPLKTSFQITFYMVLAIGHWLSMPEKEHAQAPYYSAARSMFTIRLLEAGTLGAVQALLLMVRIIGQLKCVTVH